MISRMISIGHLYFILMRCTERTCKIYINLYVLLGESHNIYIYIYIIYIRYLSLIMISIEVSYTVGTYTGNPVYLRQSPWQYVGYIALYNNARKIIHGLCEIRTMGLHKIF